MSRSASVYEFRDLDLMLALARVADNDGWAETQLVAEHVGLGENGGTRAMGQRLAWMRKFGMVERNPELHVWRLTRGGERVTESHLQAAQKRAIEAVPDDALVDVMAHVTSRYMHGDPLVANLLRREFQFGTRPR